MISVLLADDQPLAREGLVVLLRSAPDIEVVGQAADGAAAVRMARELRPDVVLMDVRMPGMDGLQATARITGEAGHPAVLVLTTFDLDEYVFEALEAGAGGFLLKDTSAEDLVAAVRVVAAGDALLAPSVTRRLIEEFRRRKAPRAAPSAGLTTREVDVVRLVAEGRTNREIAAELVLAEQTVKTYVSRILTKLDLTERTQIVVYAYRNDLVAPR